MLHILEQRSIKDLVKTPENDKMVMAYLMDIKKAVDSLGMIGAPISSEDHVEIILNGPSKDYDHFITTVTLWLDIYIADDLGAFLLAQEERFDKHKFATNSILQGNIVFAPYFMRNFNKINKYILLMWLMWNIVMSMNVI